MGNAGAFSSGAALVDDVLGNAYLIVKHVYDNITALANIASRTDAIDEIKANLDLAEASVLASNLAVVLAGVTNFRATYAEGVADFIVGEYFTSAESGELRLYKRTVGDPGYTDQGDVVAPMSKTLLAGTGGAGLIGTATPGVTVQAALNSLVASVGTKLTAAQVNDLIDEILIVFGGEVAASGSPDKFGLLGLFTDASAIEISDTTLTAATTGYSVSGKGGAHYIYDAAVDAAYVAANPRTSFRNATTGRGFRLSEDQVITPEMFGAGGRGLSDDGLAVNALFTFCLGRSNLPTPLLHGTYAHSIPLIYSNPDTLNFGDDSLYCSAFDFKCTFIATAAMDHMLTFQRINNVVATGRIRFTGGPVKARAGWLAANGLLLDYCGGSCIDAKITGSRLIYSLVETEYAPSNNNLARVASVHGSRFGASTFVDNLHLANFSGRVDTGNPNSGDQLTTFTVNSLPPAYTDDPVRPVLAVINGYHHRVVAVDRGAGTISIAPWPSSAVVAGSLRYAYGAAVSLRGNDGNLINIGTISSQGGAGALSAQALYCGTIDTIHCEAGGIAVAIGNAPTGTMLGFVNTRLYCEGADVHLACMLGVPDGVHILSATPFEESKIITSSWFSPGGAVDPVYNPLPPGIWINGKSATPARNDTSPSFIDLTAPHNRDQIWTAPDATPAFDIGLPADDAMNALYRKPLRMSVEVPAAMVASGIPETVTFNAPSGWTVNGAASVVFANIDHVPDYSISLDYDNEALFVRQLVPHTERGVHFNLPLAPGERITNQLFGVTLGTSAFAADQLDAALIHPAHDFAPASIGFDVTVPVAASNAKIAIYDYDTNARLALSGDLSTAAAGPVSWAPGFTFRKNRRYLVAVHASAAITIRAVEQRCVATMGCDASGLGHGVARQVVAFAAGPPAVLAAVKQIGPALPPCLVFTV